MAKSIPVIKATIIKILKSGGVTEGQINFRYDTSYVFLILPLNASDNAYFCVNLENGRLFFADKNLRPIGTVRGFDHLDKVLRTCIPLYSKNLRSSFPALTARVDALLSRHCETKLNTYKLPDP